MEFTSHIGPTTHVSTSSAGQRLQRFASNAFREQLGRLGASRLHASCRSAAHQQTFLVNGVAQPGRHLLAAGDIVTLVVTEPGAHQQADTSTAPASRARMAIGGATSDEDTHGDGGQRALSPSSAFACYYATQLPDLRWSELEAACAAPMPMCVRPNLSVNSQALAVHEIARMHGAALRRVPWMPAACIVASGDHAGAPSTSSPTDQPAAGPSESLEAAVSQLLLEAQSCGELALQEAAAMLPALALAPKADHRVLDMCAAPGGKTLQLLDAMMAGALGASPVGVRDPHTAQEAALAWATRLLGARGVLLSNDVQWQRQERTLRRASCQPSTPLVVTCGDAAEIGSAAPQRTSAGWSRFDRVLCDVPCTGDGTLRKSPGVVERWSVTNGLQAHGRQLRILERGLELLAPAGRLAYSTCSLDPLQNEAVVHAAMLGAARAASRVGEAHPRFRLVPPFEWLSPSAAGAVQAHAGLRTWRVPHPVKADPVKADPVKADPVKAEGVQGETGEATPVGGDAGRWYARWAEVPEELREAAGGALQPTMFPPDGEAAPGASAAAHDYGTATIDLRNVIRLLPTRNGAADHGGFFVAVVERLGVTAPARTKLERSSVDARLGVTAPASEVAAEDAAQPAAQPAAEAMVAGLMGDAGSSSAPAPPPPSAAALICPVG